LFANNPSLRAYLEARELCPQPDCRSSSNASEFEAVAVLGLLSRPSGATIATIMRSTGWQPHTVRGVFAAVARGSRRFALWNVPKLLSVACRRLTHQNQAIDRF
jgi:hypothetical protein